MDLVLTAVELVEGLGAAALRAAADACAPTADDVAAVRGFAAARGASGGYADFVYRAAAGAAPDAPLPFARGSFWRRGNVLGGGALDGAAAAGRRRRRRGDDAAAACARGDNTRRGAGRNDDVVEATLNRGPNRRPLKFAVATGFRNVQRVVAALQRAGPAPAYDFVELLACPVPSPARASLFSSNPNPSVRTCHGGARALFHRPAPPLFATREQLLSARGFSRRVFLVAAGALRAAHTRRRAARTAAGCRGRPARTAPRRRRASRACRTRTRGRAGRGLDRFLLLLLSRGRIFPLDVGRSRSDAAKNRRVRPQVPRGASRRPAMRRGRRRTRRRAAAAPHAVPPRAGARGDAELGRRGEQVVSFFDV